MSVEHRPPENPPESGVPHSRSDQSARSPRESTLSPRTASDDRRPPGHRHPLEHRIEQTQLQLQVAALERTLRQSERRRQAVLEQYELVLADRTSTAADAESSDADSSDDDPLARVKRAIPGLGQ